MYKGEALPKVKLVSDFNELYDFMFDIGDDCIELHRLSRYGNRRNDFSTMQGMGLHVPYYDTVERIADLISAWNVVKIVLYFDIYAHRVMGKRMYPLSPDIVVQYPINLASIYIENDPIVSYRYLRLGKLTFWLKYQSDDDWRSNCGNVEITEIDNIMFGFEDPQDFPLLAIDFVVSKQGMWWAVDFNTSPGIKGTPIVDEITPTEIVNSIKEWYVEHPPT